MFDIPNKKWFRTDEVAEILGYSPRTVRRMVASGDFPNATKKALKHIRIPKEDVKQVFNEIFGDKRDKRDTRNLQSS